MFTTTTVTLWLILIALKLLEVNGRRGPHHPRGQVAQSRPPKLDEHLEHEREHLSEDLGKIVTDMTEEEKNFYYFKVHDTDNNDLLDGLEMLQAATHRSGHLHKLDRDNELESMENELKHIVGKLCLINLYNVLK